MDKIRRLTAEHMVVAKRIAPHVHSFIEIDFTAIDSIRAANRKRWEEQGARVSYTAFVAWAVSRVLREFPMVNATVSGNNLVYRGNVNLGMAVDLNPGLIVPVIKDADELGLVGIAKKLLDLAERARSRKLDPGRDPGGDVLHHEPGGPRHPGGDAGDSQGHVGDPGHGRHREARGRGAGPRHRG